MVCVLCRYHLYSCGKPSGYEFAITPCPGCGHTYPEEWGYGVYRWVSTSRWYNPFSWGDFKWENKLNERQSSGKEKA